jgi:hypothetical protein
MIQPPPPPLAPRLLPRAGVALASSAASFVLCCLRPRSLSPGSAGLPHNPHALRNLIKVVVPISQKGKLAPSQAQPLGGKAHWGRATSGEGLREVALWGPGLGRYEGTGDLPVLGALEHQSLGILAGGLYTAVPSRASPGSTGGSRGFPAGESPPAGPAKAHSSAGPACALAGWGPRVTPPGQAAGISGQAGRPGAGTSTAAPGQAGGRAGGRGQPRGRSRRRGGADIRSARAPGRSEPVPPPPPP